MSPLRTTLLTLLVGGAAALLVSFAFFGKEAGNGRLEGPGQVFPGLEAQDVRRLTLERRGEKVLVERAAAGPSKASPPPAGPTAQAPAQLLAQAPAVVPARASAHDGGGPASAATAAPLATAAGTTRGPTDGGLDGGARGIAAGALTGEPSAAPRAATPHYRILEPRRLEADDEAIHALLVRLGRLVCLREVEQAGDPGGYGLSPPRVALEAFTSTGVRRLELGGPDRFGGGVFARVPALTGSGTRVVVLSEDDGRALDRGLQELRERRLLRASLQHATALRIDVGRTRASLLRTGTGEWSLMGLSPADEDAVQALLLGFSSLHAVRYLDEGKPRSLAAHGLEPPDVAVRIDVGAATYRLALSKRQAGTIVAAELAGGTVAEVALSLWPSLVRAPHAWRSTRALRFERARVGTLRWSRQGALVMVSRMKDGSWQALAPSPGPANGRAIDGLLASLERLVAHDPDDTPRALPSYGLEPATLELAVDDLQGVRMDALHVGHRVGTHRYARSVRWPAVFKIDESAIVALEKAQLGLGAAKKANTARPILPAQPAKQAQPAHGAIDGGR